MSIVSRIESELKKKLDNHLIFELNKADIISSAISVDHDLEFFISNYFVRPQTQKTFFLSDAIITELKFQEKISIFKKICKREEYDNAEISKIIKSIKFVQETRNKVAHWQTMVDGEDNIMLHINKSCYGREHMLELTDSFMQRFFSEQKKANEGIVKYYLKYYQEKTIDEINDTRF